MQLSPAHTSVNGDITGYHPRNWGNTYHTGGNETRPDNAAVLYIIKH